MGVQTCACPICRAHQHIGGEHFGETADRFAELVEIGATVRVELDLRKDMRAEPDLAPVEDRDALAHIALALEPVDAPPAGRYRQADALGDLGGGLARVALEFAKDFYLECIKIGHSFPIDHKSRS